MLLMRHSGHYVNIRFALGAPIPQIIKSWKRNATKDSLAWEHRLAKQMDMFTKLFLEHYPKEDPTELIDFEDILDPSQQIISNDATRPQADPGKDNNRCQLADGNTLEHGFGDSVSIQYCTWKHLRFDLHELIYEEDPVQFDQGLEQFKSKWTSHREFLDYFQRQWLDNGKHVHWARCYQPSMYRNMERIISSRQLFRAQEIKADNFPAARLESAVVKINDASFQVASFQENNTDVRYEVQADGLHLDYCICDAFRSNGRAFKHLFLVARVHGKYHVRPPIPSFNRQCLPDIPTTQLLPTVAPTPPTTVDESPQRAQKLKSDISAPLLSFKRQLDSRYFSEDKVEYLEGLLAQLNELQNSARHNSFAAPNLISKDNSSFIKPVSTPCPLACNNLHTVVLPFLILMSCTPEPS
ncbi:hypothetical protein VTP01DRAFT_8070 [Rhizomucor pusillus]|uniref:uncharacterized protein n=1 Tax=Rhizomucor pusillus TaxID=4840 RepID=UPI0037437190